MKNIILLIVLLIPNLSKSQAHLSATLSDIQSMHPDKVFKSGITDDGTKYTSTEMVLGTFIYYFDGTTDLSYLCIQIPSNMTNLNTQVEIYNKKYVITSKTSWTAYLEGGGMMYIRLKYSEEDKMYLFYYASTEI